MLRFDEVAGGQTTQGSDANYGQHICVAKHVEVDERVARLAAVTVGHHEKIAHDRINIHVYVLNHQVHLYLLLILLLLALKQILVVHSGKTRT